LGGGTGREVNFHECACERQQQMQYNSGSRKNNIINNNDRNELTTWLFLFSINIDDAGDAN
jgi:hypothetical protein